MTERMGNNRREYCKTHARNSISVTPDMKSSEKERARVLSGF